MGRGSPAVVLDSRWEDWAPVWAIVQPRVAQWTPMGSLVVLAPVFASARLPVEGVGILIAVDLVPDIFKTIANVTGHMAAAAGLSRATTAHVVQCS
jgi:hypothetical protein